MPCARRMDETAQARQRALCARGLQSSNSEMVSEMVPKKET